MRTLLFCLVALVLALSSAANAQELLLDINREGVGSDPSDLLKASDLIFFRAKQPETGRELWVSDGTEAGTHLVKDIVPGIEGSFPTPQVTIGQEILFTTNNPHAIWRTDGTETGTRLLKDFGDGRPYGIVPVGAQIFFGVSFGNDSVWWVTDGTEENTREVFGPGFQWPENIHTFTAFQDSLFFITYDNDRGKELWKMHPEEASPTRVFGQETMQISFVSVVGDRLFVIGWDPINHFGLWLSDGTFTGTTFITDIMETSQYFFSIIGSISDKLVFLTDNDTNGFELWVSDGTSEGTMLLADLERAFWDSVVTSDRIFFVAHNSAVGTELWTTDGTPEGTHIVKDINPGAANSYPESLTIVNGQLLFCATDGIHGFELWTSDGTEDETRMLIDFNPGPGDGVPGSATAFVGGFILGASDGIHGRELWLSDGSAEGSRMIKDLAQGGTSSASIGQMVEFQRRLFFVADDGANGSELWSSDGSGAGTQQVIDLFEGTDGSSLQILGEVNQKLIVDAKSRDSGQALWAFSDHSSPPARLTTLEDGINSIDPNSAISNNIDELIINMGNEAYGKELWITDGTVEGTRRVTDIAPGAESSWPVPMGFVNGKWVFGVNVSGFEGLWSTDGTTLGTQRISTNGSFIPGQVVSLHDFLLYPGGSRNNLQRTDGTASGTTNVTSAPAYNLTRVGNRVFFSGSLTRGTELSITDGTSEGTHIVRDIVPGSNSADVSKLIAADGDLYFIADDGVHGRELWVSDGSDTGTKLVADINPSQSSRGPTPLLFASPYLFFAADDGTHGDELWITDGTTAGTRLLADIFVGSQSSFPRSTVRIGDYMYFKATHPDYGREIWKLDLGALGVATERFEANPEEIELAPAFPNPFQSQTTIVFSLPRTANVHLALYNLLGQEVRQLEHSLKPPGIHRVVVDAAGLASGVYFYRLTARGFTQSRKMVLLR